MLAANLKLKLGDFGLAILEKEIHKVKSMCGTPNYLAPEVINKKEYSYEVDLWAVGVLTYVWEYAALPVCWGLRRLRRRLVMRLMRGSKSVSISSKWGGTLSKFPRRPSC